MKVIERFHSRGQQSCKFIGTKESFYIRKELNSYRIGLGHQHGRRFIVLVHQYGCRDVMCFMCHLPTYMCSFILLLLEYSLLQEGDI